MPLKENTVVGHSLVSKMVDVNAGLVISPNDFWITILTTK